MGMLTVVAPVFQQEYGQNPGNVLQGCNLSRCPPEVCGTFIEAHIATEYTLITVMLPLAQVMTGIG